MFARRQLATAVPAASRGFSFSAPAILAKPWALPAGAAALLAGSLLLFILATGDPHAGAPKVQVALDSAKPTGDNALRGGLPAEGGAPTLGSLPPGQDVGMAGAPDPLTAQINIPMSGGQAVITLPQGASMSGAASPSGPAKPPAAPLTPAPIAGLAAPGPGGLLPVIAKDGRTAFQAYARPFASNGKPKIAIVVGALGLNSAETRAAIEKLPPEITLSFAPYADGLQGWIDLARANGHEVLLEIPMEPMDYPANDPGPMTLMASSSPAEIAKRLEFVLSRASGYFATTNYLGGKFVTADAAIGALVGALKGRGLGFLDDGSARKTSGAGAPRASADSVVDEQLSADAIEQQLRGLEAKAAQHGQALGAGFAYPVTVDQVTRWANALAGRGYQLAPASAVMRK